MAAVIKTVKLPPATAAALARAAKAGGCTESELIREGIERVTAEDGGGIDMLAAIGAEIGIGRGPRDLARNKAHRAKYGRSRDR